jgi:ADP-ribosylglycohydrolase
MLGAIVGDIVGSVYEATPIKCKDFPLLTDLSTFTDDTVLTVAVARAILDRSPYVETLKHFGRRYPHAGYGASFYQWIFASHSAPYNSWGNGSAMRVSPVGLAFDTAEDVLNHARRTAEVTHNHPEGIKGAQATALAVFLARTGASKADIKQNISMRFGYNLDRTLEAIRPIYSFDVSCQGSVPESIIAFLESVAFEDAIRNAVSLGGDSDTMACIAGAIAQAFYQEIPANLVAQVRRKLPAEFLDIIDAFQARYGP